MHGFGVDKINTDKPDDQPLLGQARNNHPSALISLAQTTPDASYDGKLVLKLWFANHSKSPLVAVTPHAQAANGGMDIYTDLMRAGLIQKASDGTLISDKSEFQFSELALRGMPTSGGKTHRLTPPALNFPGNANRPTAAHHSIWRKNSTPHSPTSHGTRHPFPRTALRTTTPPQARRPCPVATRPGRPHPPPCRERWQGLCWTKRHAGTCNLPRTGAVFVCSSPFIRSERRHSIA